MASVAVPVAITLEESGGIENWYFEMTEPPGSVPMVRLLDSLSPQVDYKKLSGSAQGAWDWFEKVKYVYEKWKFDKELKAANRRRISQEQINNCLFNYDPNNPDYLFTKEQRVQLYNSAKGGYVAVVATEAMKDVLDKVPVGGYFDIHLELFGNITGTGVRTIAPNAAQAGRLTIQAASATPVTVAFGLQGVVAANRVVVPLLVTAVLAVSISSLAGRGIGPGWKWWQPGAAAHPSWGVTAVLYASYNLFFSLGVLAPLGASAWSGRTLVAGGAIGGMGLGIAALAVHLGVLSSLPASAALAIPMLEAASLLPPWAGTAYALVLFAEIYTTGVANLFALERRLSPPGGSSPRQPRPGGAGSVRGRGGVQRAAVLVGMGALALLASRLGFPRLVVTIYPLAGYVGLLIMLGLPVALWRTGRL